MSGPAGWLADPRAKVAAGIGAVAVVAVVVTLVLTNGSSAAQDPRASTGDPGSAASPGATSSPKAPSSSAPADKPSYCAAYASIRSGGFETGTDDGGTDLAELSRKFNELIVKYVAASGLAPASLRPDYERALGYLTQGKAAVDSGEVDQVKLLVRSLPALNDSITAIQTQSDRICA